MLLLQLIIKHCVIQTVVAVVSAKLTCDWAMKGLGVFLGPPKHVNILLSCTMALTLNRCFCHIAASS